MRPLPLALPLLLLLAPASGCLPGDTRPAPQSLLVTAEPSPATEAGFETADGFRVEFERLVLALGSVDFEEDDASCNSYAEAYYDRLFDFAVAGREKVGTVYGLGTCRVEFRLRSPSADALLGPGATPADKVFMRTRASDPYAEAENASVLATGAATRGDVRKRFGWVFRRSYEITDCEGQGGEGLATTVLLREGESGELPLEVRGEELFREGPDDSAPLLFARIASADADRDGVVTLDELPLVPSFTVPEATDSLARVVYEDLLPRLVRVRGGGACRTEERSRR